MERQKEKGVGGWVVKERERDERGERGRKRRNGDRKRERERKRERGVMICPVISDSKADDCLGSFI